MAAVTMFIAAMIDVESILFMGPVLTVAGLVLAVVTRPLLSWPMLCVGLSGPLVCALIAYLIVIGNWGTIEAYVPTAVITGLYAMCFFPATAVALASALKRQATCTTSTRPASRYSLKSLLYVMTSICILLVVGRLVAEVIHDEGVIFGGYALVVVALCGLVLWRFIAYRQRITIPATSSPPSESS
jgi:hypothetical protein